MYVKVNTVFVRLELLTEHKITKLLVVIGTLDHRA